MDVRTVPSWQCVILTGPPLAPFSLSDYCRERRLICTAHGVPFALEQGCVPEAVVGEVGMLASSLRERLHQSRARVLTPAAPHSEEALELALNYAITTGARDILLLGLVRDTLAESLSHLLLLARAEWGAARLTFVHGDETGYLLRHGEAAAISGHVGDEVLLLALSPSATEITTQGMAPRLRGATLELGRAGHLTMTEPVAHVWLGAGRLLVLHRA